MEIILIKKYKKDTGNKVSDDIMAYVKWLEQEVTNLSTCISMLKNKSSW